MSLVFQHAVPILHIKYAYAVFQNGLFLEISEIQPHPSMIHP